KLKLDVPPEWVVYDVFAQKKVAYRDGVTCDLRTIPARLFAVLPPDSPLPGPKARPVEDLFGPHLRSVAVSADGKTAVINAFNWDHNLYAVDLETGETAWRQKVGHGFAFDPVPAGRGFAVQGFDTSTGEGYHLYQLGQDGTPQRRFALFGLPKRA